MYFNPMSLTSWLQFFQKNHFQVICNSQAFQSPYCVSSVPLKFRDVDGIISTRCTIQRKFSEVTKIIGSLENYLCTFLSISIISLCKTVISLLRWYLLPPSKADVIGFPEPKSIYTLAELDTSTLPSYLHVYLEMFWGVFLGASCIKNQSKS